MKQLGAQPSAERRTSGVLSGKEGGLPPLFAAPPR